MISVFDTIKFIYNKGKYIYLSDMNDLSIFIPISMRYFNKI